MWVPIFFQSIQLDSCLTVKSLSFFILVSEVSSRDQLDAFLLKATTCDTI